MIISEGLWDDIARVIDPYRPRNRQWFQQQVDQLMEKYSMLEAANVASWILKGVVRDRVGKPAPTDLEIEQLINEIMAGMSTWASGITRGSFQRAIRVSAGHFLEGIGSINYNMALDSMVAATILLEPARDRWLDLLAATRQEVETVKPNQSAAEPATIDHIKEYLRAAGVKNPEKFLRKHGMIQT